MTMMLYNTDYLHPYDLNGILVYETRMCGVLNNYPDGRRTVPNAIFDMYRNNHRTLRVFVKTPELDVVDLTGAVCILTVKAKKEDAVALISKITTNPTEGEIGAADEGEVFFYIVPNDTVNLDIQQYVFSVNVSLSNGKTYTVIEGIINLTQPVG